MCIFFLFFSKPFSFFQVLNPCHIYFFLVVTVWAKSRPFKPGHLTELLVNFFRLKLPLLLLQIVPLGGPLSLMKLVKLLVSNPVMPTILFFFSQASSFFNDLLFEGLVISVLNITPFVQILSDSWSSLLVPTFPIWGKVKLIICPA